MVVIIVLGIMFATANKHRDRKFAEGSLEYDPALTTGLEDVSDWNNKAFRYVGEFSALHYLPACGDTRWRRSLRQE